jgi:hypothetical protein
VDRRGKCYLLIDTVVERAQFAFFFVTVSRVGRATVWKRQVSDVAWNAGATAGLSVLWKEALWRQAGGSAPVSPMYQAFSAEGARVTPVAVQRRVGDCASRVVMCSD